jgi:hypothetical protein
MSDPITEPNVTTATEPVKTEKTFSQAELEAIVKDRLERANRKAEAEREQARKDAEAKALAEQGEFRTLAEQRQSRIAELEAETNAAKSTQKTLERYQEAVKGLVTPRLEALPDALKARIASLDPLEALEWLAALQPTDDPEPRKKAPNIDAQERGRAMSRDERINAQAEELRRKGGYSGL